MIHTKEGGGINPREKEVGSSSKLQALALPGGPLAKTPHLQWNEDGGPYML